MRRESIRKRQLFLALGFTLLLLADIGLAILIFPKNKNLAHHNNFPLIYNNYSDLAYDASPDVIVLYVDSQINSGAPRQGVICRFPTVPILRIWGDGLTFLDNSTSGGVVSLYAGQLSPDQIQAVLQFLSSRGFISDPEKFSKIWSPSGPNPAANWFYIGVHLKTFDKEYSSGDTPPALFGELIKVIKPSLSHLSPVKGYDARIDGLNIGTRDCHFAATPTPGATPISSLDASP